MITNLDPIENDRRERQVCLRRENNYLRDLLRFLSSGGVTLRTQGQGILVERCQVVMFSLRHQKERWSSFLSLNM